MSDIKIGIAIPTAGWVRMGFAGSLCGMVAKFGAEGVPTVPEAKISMSIHALESSNWITNREKLARDAVTAGETHLMFLDDDMTFDSRVLEIMLGRRQQIVVTNYLIKTEPASSADFVAVGMNGQRLPTKANSVGIQPILYSGFGVSLIEVEVFKNTAQPWFMPDFNPESGEYTTEDNPFFRRAREAGFTVYLDHDASKLVSHLGMKSWNWSEVKDG